MDSSITTNEIDEGISQVAMNQLKRKIRPRTLQSLDSKNQRRIKNRPKTTIYKIPDKESFQCRLQKFRKTNNGRFEVSVVPKLAKKFKISELIKEDKTLTEEGKEVVKEIVQELHGSSLLLYQKLAKFELIKEVLDAGIEVEGIELRSF